MKEQQYISEAFLQTLEGRSEKSLKDEKTKHERAALEIDKEIATLEQSIRDKKAAAFDIAHIEEERNRVVAELKDIEHETSTRKTALATNAEIIKLIDKKIRTMKEKKDEEAMLRFLKSSGIRSVESLKKLISK